MRGPGRSGRGKQITEQGDQADADQREEMTGAYRELAKSGLALQEKAEQIRQELQDQEHDLDPSGPFFCDYSAWVPAVKTVPFLKKTGSATAFRRAAPGMMDGR